MDRSPQSIVQHVQRIAKLITILRYAINGNDLEGLSRLPQEAIGQPDCVHYPTPHLSNDRFVHRPLGGRYRLAGPY